MELNVKEVRDWAINIIENTYMEKEVPSIKEAFLKWFDAEEGGWYDVYTNPNDFAAQDAVTVFIDNFYDTEEDEG